VKIGRTIIPKKKKKKKKNGLFSTIHYATLPLREVDAE